MTNWLVLKINEKMGMLTSFAKFAINNQMNVIKKEHNKAIPAPIKCIKLSDGRLSSRGIFNNEEINGG